MILVVGQSHLLFTEDACVHELEVLGDLRLEVHLVEYLGLQVDAGCDLDQRNALGTQLKHSALGDVQNRLMHLVGRKRRRR